MSRKQTIKKHLALLGDSSAAIAASLKQKGIKGRCWNAFDCPIVNYFVSLGYSYVSVYPGFIEVKKDVWQHDERIRTSTAVEDFTLDFDRGKYPKLIQESKVKP